MAEDPHCEHEANLRKDGWEPEIVITVWAKNGTEDREVHYHGPKTILDYAHIIRTVTEWMIELEVKRLHHE